MLLSPQLLAELADEIKLQHLGYATQILGVAALGISDDVYAQLVNGGYVAPEQVEDHVLAAYRAGHVEAWHDTRPGVVTAAKTQASYDAALKAGMAPLSPQQRYAVDFASQRSAQYILGLGNRVHADLITLAIETETEARNEAKARIAEVVTDAVINNWTAQKLASRLGDATDDWARDLKRIAVTELEYAYQNGYADHIEEQVGPDATVYKRVNDDACDTCRKLLLDDGQPRTFTLAELRGNGSNFGKKQKEWLPVIGPQHPNCHCVLVHMPAGFGFNAKGQMLPLAAVAREAA